MAKKKITIEQITMAETQLQTMQRQVDLTLAIAIAAFSRLQIRLVFAFFGHRQ